MASQFNRRTVSDGKLFIGGKLDFLAEELSNLFFVGKLDNKNMFSKKWILKLATCMRPNFIS